MSNNEEIIQRPIRYIVAGIHLGEELYYHSSRYTDDWWNDEVDTAKLFDSLEDAVEIKNKKWSLFNNKPYIYEVKSTLSKIIEKETETEEIINDFKVGDICIYPVNSESKSLALVQIEKILEDEQGIAEIKFIKVYNDATGNNYFTYLLNTGKTMNGSFKYLKNIIPRINED